MSNILTFNLLPCLSYKVFLSDENPDNTKLDKIQSKLVAQGQMILQRIFLLFSSSFKRTWTYHSYSLCTPTQQISWFYQ